MTISTGPDGTCPTCQTQGSMLRYVWGRPTADDTVNPRPWTIYGGCIVPSPRPAFACGKCRDEFDASGVSVIDGPSWITVAGWKDLRRGLQGGWGVTVSRVCRDELPASLQGGVDDLVRSRPQVDAGDLRLVASYGEPVGVLVEGWLLTVLGERIDVRTRLEQGQSADGVWRLLPRVGLAP